MLARSGARNPANQAPGAEKKAQAGAQAHSHSFRGLSRAGGDVWTHTGQLRSPGRGRHSSSQDLEEFGWAVCGCRASLGFPMVRLRDCPRGRLRHEVSGGPGPAGAASWCAVGPSARAPRHPHEHIPMPLRWQGTVCTKRAGAPGRYARHSMAPRGICRQAIALAIPSLASPPPLRLVGDPVSVEHRVSSFAASLLGHVVPQRFSTLPAPTKGEVPPLGDAV